MRHRRWILFGTLVILSLGIFALAKVAFADPHATFFTDRAQEQLFFNVLAALNQADYVEPPDQPFIETTQDLGRTVSSGIQDSPRPSPAFTPVRDSAGNIIGFDRFPAIEPNEPFPLPRIRVRPVTADDGDLYTRELLQKRARVEAQRVELSNLLCSVRRLYLGEEGAKDCLEQAQQHSLNLR